MESLSPVPASPRQPVGRLMVALLIGLFLVMAFLPDMIWEGRKTYFAIYSEPFQSFTVLHPLPSEWFSTGGSGKENDSLPYMALLRVFYSCIPDRLRSMRMLSVAATVVSLLLLYRLGSILYSRSVGVLFVFLLVTSPIYLESMRAFGYHSLSHMAIIVVCCLTAAEPYPRPLLKNIGLAFFCTLSLSLYIAARAVILLPLGYFILTWRRSWRRLAVFLICFLAMILVLEIAFGNPLFNYGYYFYNPPEPGAEWVMDGGKFSVPMFFAHVSDNLQEALDYLSGRDRRPFADRDPKSRLFNAIYLPFLGIGVVSCLRRRRSSAVFLVLLVGIFFFLPMASSGLQPRRVLFAIYPIYLLIALGLYGTWNMLRRFCSRRRYRAAALGLACGFLGVLAIGDWREYLFEVTRPPLNADAAQLRQMASFLSAQRRLVDWIRYDREIDELVMGNPYFQPQPDSAAGAASIFGEETIGLPRTARIFMVQGMSTLYLLHPPVPSVADSVLEWAEQNIGELVEKGVIPSTDIRWVRFDFREIAPNLLHVGARMSVSPNFEIANLDLNSYNNEVEFFNMVDMNPWSRCDIRLDPSGSPVWLTLDYGTEDSRAVREVVVFPGKGKEAAVFSEAALLGSDDGERWEEIALLETAGQKGIPYFIWAFPNSRCFRYYRFEIRDAASAHPGGIVSLGGIWMFDLAPRRWKAEDIVLLMLQQVGRRWSEASLM